MKAFFNSKGKKLLPYMGRLREVTKRVPDSWKESIKF